MLNTLKKPNPSEIVLYSENNCLHSHAVRFISREKDLECIIENVEFSQIPEDIIAQNPTEAMPTLFDRGLVLYDMNVILEYLDERFPFPAMLPVDPIEKAEKRILIYRFTRAKDNWYDLVAKINNGNKKEANDARKLIMSNLVDLAALFAYKDFFNSDALGAVDAVIAPVLWRLDSIGIELNKTPKPIIDYANRIFNLESFQNSLTNAERELR